MTKPRKITVDGKEYRYFVGKYTTKVQPLDTMKSEFYMNEDYGTPVVACDYSYADDPDYESLQSKKPYKYILGPGEIRGMIEGKRKWQDKICKKHGHKITGMCPDPYESRIHERIVYVSNCPQCICNKAWNI